MRYTVALEPSEEGIAVWVPSLPGCVSQGETADEALANIAEAIQAYLAVVAENASGFRDSSRRSSSRLIYAQTWLSKDAISTKESR